MTSLDNIINIIKSKNNIGESQEELEDYFHQQLSILFEKGELECFKTLIEKSIPFNIHLDLKRIPKRLEIISILHKKLLRTSMTDQYQTFLGEIINLLRFCFRYNLFEMEEIPLKSLELIEEIKQDRLLLKNLEDLFGGYSTSFLYYIRFEMPKEIYEYFQEMPYVGFDLLRYNQLDSANLIRMYFNHYSTYGLSVLNLGPISHFLNAFDEEAKQGFTNSKTSTNSELFLKYVFNEKTILVSPTNISRNRKKILDKRIYNFYSLAMVLFKGIGPQGHGFLYSTPKGEVIEICSDRTENQAIIVKQKQFFKQQFLKRLDRQLTEYHINKETRKKIIIYLKKKIKQDEVINIYRKNQILTRISIFLKESIQSTILTEDNILNLTEKISKALDLIFREIRMEDQFKARMKLVEQEKLTSEEIAKFTSLREKSHYDVLRERFFFQYVIEWFYKIFLKEYAKSWK
ncbi:MAG: hypothetical protein JW891_15410 [Candidatus Lokiarchaeota archaeon]|nr:hypothetical protein [Candidatus Lokiarchaeota archaeon]